MKQNDKLIKQLTILGHRLASVWRVIVFGHFFLNGGRAEQVVIRLGSCLVQWCNRCQVVAPVSYRV